MYQQVMNSSGWQFDRTAFHPPKNRTQTAVHALPIHQQTLLSHPTLNKPFNKTPPQVLHFIHATTTTHPPQCSYDTPPLHTTYNVNQHAQLPLCVRRHRASAALFSGSKTQQTQALLYRDKNQSSHGQQFRRSSSRYCAPHPARNCNHADWLDRFGMRSEFVCGYRV
ncbi:hypothetical protein K470DRAFT_278499 [Piedraia hortae CBS 480.64]|uniref:Uncharacterized protein n=1 Tax=Piedraia hortae CBS 480.64 TaxID=1314780 RepID=A0A6A7BU49_9PEZI|nr:hypothetical protein K470DRAFT_278499 [Piedraia hortae CBS 480.64]